MIVEEEKRYAIYVSGVAYSQDYRTRNKEMMVDGYYNANTMSYNNNIIVKSLLKAKLWKRKKDAENKAYYLSKSRVFKCISTVVIEVDVTLKTK